MRDDTQILLNRGRAICPKCNAKGVGYAPHPHAYGYKSFDEAKCRYCSTYFKVSRDDATGTKIGDEIPIKRHTT